MQYPPKPSAPKNDSLVDYGHMIDVEKYTPIDRGISPAFINAYKVDPATNGLVQLNPSEIMQMQESHTQAFRQRAGFQDYKARNQISREKSPAPAADRAYRRNLISRETTPLPPKEGSGYQVINYN